MFSQEDGVYGTSKSVFPGGARACRPDGRGAPGGPRLRVGGAAVGGAEARMHGVYKTEVIRRKGPWRTLKAVEFATLTWVDWFNTRRLLGPLGDIPPAEFEAQYYEQAEVA